MIEINKKVDLTGKSNKKTNAVFEESSEDDDELFWTVLSVLIEIESSFKFTSG